MISCKKSRIYTEIESSDRWYRVTCDKSLTDELSDQESILKVALLVLLRDGSSYILLIPPSYKATKSRLTRGKLIPRRLSRTRRNDVIYGRGVRSALGKIAGWNVVAKDLNLLELIPHFWGDYGSRHSIYGVTL